MIFYISFANSEDFLGGMLAEGDSFEAAVEECYKRFPHLSYGDADACGRRMKEDGLEGLAPLNKLWQLWSMAEMELWMDVVPLSEASSLEEEEGT